MPLKRAELPPDPPEVIRTRERLRPIDHTKLIFDSPSTEQMFDFCFVCTRDSIRAMYQSNGWVPVNAKGDGVKCPGAYGDTTDNRIHVGDSILYKRPKEIGDQERADRKAMDEYEQKTRYARNRQLAKESKVKDLKEEVILEDPADDD